MKQVLLFLLSFTALSCSKDEPSCDLAGTWAMVDNPAVMPEVLGVEFIFKANGQMVFGGRTGYFWETSEDCQTLHYWTAKEAPFKHRLPILSNDGKYLLLDMDSLDGGRGLGVWGKVKLKKIA